MGGWGYLWSGGGDRTQLSHQSIWCQGCDIAVSLREGLKEGLLLGMKKIKRTNNRDITEESSDNHSQFKMVMKDRERPGSRFW